MQKNSPLFLVAPVLASWMLASCGEKPVEDYRVDKDPQPEAAAPAVPSGQAPSIEGEASLKWDAPTGWQRRPGEGMRYATFVIPGGAEMSVVVLPGQAGGAGANVNRWRGQIGLPALDDNALFKQSAQVKSAAGSSLVVDCVGKDASKGAEVRLVGAILSSGGQAWFFKLMGPPAAVARAKPAFLEFLGSLR